MPHSTSTFILATGGYDTSVRFFDAQNQNLIRTLQFCDQQVICIAFSGSGPVPVNQPLYIVVGGSPTVCVYDISTADTPPNVFAPYKGHTEAVTAVGFEPKHTSFVYSASEDGTLQTWLPHSALAPPPQVHSVPPPYPNPAMANGTYPHAPAVNRRLGRSPPPSGRRFTPTKFENGGPGGLVPINDATYYPPGDLFFTVDAKGRLRVWDHEAGTLRRELVPARSRRSLQCLELSSDYRILVMANFDGFVFVYNVRNLLSAGSLRKDMVTTTDSGLVVPICFRANSSYITRLRLSASRNLLVCTTKQGAIKVFRMADVMASSSRQVAREQSQDEIVSPVWDFGSHPGWVWDAAFVGDSEDYLFTCNSNIQVMLWTLNNIGRSLEYKGLQKSVVCLAVKERCVGKPADQFGLDPSQVPLPSEYTAPAFTQYGEGLGRGPVGNGPSNQSGRGAGAASGTA